MECSQQLVSTRTTLQRIQQRVDMKLETEQSRDAYNNYANTLKGWNAESFQSMFSSHMASGPFITSAPSIPINELSEPVESKPSGYRILFHLTN